MITITLLVSAWILGLLGSFHCVGMCGPIALSLPIQHLKGWSKGAGIVLYNSGRALTYSVFGFMLGWLGSGFSFFGWQQTFSIVIGCIFLIAFIPAIFQKRIFKNSSITKYWNQFIIAGLAKLFHRKDSGTLLLIGMLNGLLPCGMVYMAAAGATVTGHAWTGAAFMAAFGLGTMPAMATMNYAGNLISLKFRQKIRLATPYIIGLMGLIFVLRGMNLDIPYVSPAQHHNSVSCCHPQ